MGYPAYIDNGGIADDAGASVDVPYPSTVNEDDILIVQLLDADNDTFSAPTGWTLIFQEGAEANASHGYYWKRAIGSETGTETFSSNLTAGAGIYGIMARFSGCTTTGTPYDKYYGNLISQTSDLYTTGTHYNGGDRLGCVFISIEDNLAVTGGAPYTLGYNEYSTLGGDAGLHFYYTEGSTSPIGSEQFNTPYDYQGYLQVILIGGDSPTIELNSPTGGATGISLTPQLLFTGTDEESQDVEYFVQIDTINTFDSSESKYITTYSDYYVDAHVGWEDLHSNWSNEDNAFDGSTATVASAGSNNDENLNATGTTVPVTGELTGRTITLVETRLYGEGDSYTATISTYDGTDQLENSRSNVGGVAGWGDWSYLDDPIGGWTWQKARNLNFILVSNINYGNDYGKTDIRVHYTSLTGSTIEADSETPDPGFLDNPDVGDTHPFTSGTQISYTVQSGDELTISTEYFWRVKSRTPSGNYIWGDWSSTRSFTTGTGEPRRRFFFIG